MSAGHASVLFLRFLWLQRSLYCWRLKSPAPKHRWCNGWRSSMLLREAMRAPTLSATLRLSEIHWDSTWINHINKLDHASVMIFTSLDISPACHSSKIIKKNKLWIVPRFVQAQDPASIQAEITALFPQLKLPIFSRHGWLWAKQAPMNIIPAPCDCYVVMSAQQNYIYYLQLCVRVSNVEALHVYIYIYIYIYWWCILCLGGVELNLFFEHHFIFQKNCQDKIGKYW